MSAKPFLDSSKESLLPCSVTPSPSAPTLVKSTSYKHYLFVFLIILFLLPVSPFSLYLRYTTGNERTTSGVDGGESLNLDLKSKSGCPEQVEPLDVGPTWELSEELKKTLVKRLVGAVQIPTISYDDMGTPTTDKRFTNLLKLHEYLSLQYPLLHENLELEKVEQFGLLYTWKGKEEGLKPIVLMAHQDVVPVDPASESRWTYPPFSGHQDSSGWIWGRGVADCKNTLIGIMSAVEQLLVEGFVPERTIILSFGFDEEIGGSRSAHPLAQLLETRYGKHGISLLLDEGFTGISTEYGGTKFAKLGMVEKGALSVTLEVLTTGGHSSVPAKHTSIGILALLLVQLEKERDSVRIGEGNPILSFLQCAAKHGEMDDELREKVRDQRRWNELGEELSRDDDVMRAFLSTTQAVDLVSGGIKINALPEQATASINYRLSFSSSISSTFTRISTLLAPLVSSLNMTFSIENSHPEIINQVVRLDIVNGSRIDVAPRTRAEGEAWELMSGTVRRVFEGAVVAPSGMIANTDTKWYWNVSEQIYRFVPAQMDLIQAFHTVDERIHESAHFTSAQFYYKLMQNTQGWKAL